MDHNETIRLQAAVKYVLGELSPVQREEYEEHYFDCAECAVDLKALATFADTTREVLRQEKSAQLVPAAAPASAGWFRWFQPIVAIPAFAALLLIIMYQNTVTIPQAKNTPSPSITEVYGQSVLIRPSDIRRGGETSDSQASIEVRPHEGFLLQLDFIPSSAFPAYLCQLQDASGRVLEQLSVPAEKAKQELHVPIPAGSLSQPGKYNLIFLGADPVSGKAVNGAKVQSFTFQVAFRP